MTVGWWPGEWLAFDADGRPDPERTVGTLRHARQILEEWARRLSG